MEIWKTPKPGLNKPHLLAAWNEVKNTTSDATNVWNEEDQVKLETLENEEIKLSDTEVGRQADKILNDAISILSNCSKVKLDQLQDAISSQYPLLQSQDEIQVQELQDEDQVIDLRNAIVPVPNQKLEEEEI